MCDDEVACVTAGTALIALVLDDADAMAQPPPASWMAPWVSPEDELRVRLPAMLSQLTPAARALIRDHQRHVAELVAGLHSALRAS